MSTLTPPLKRHGGKAYLAKKIIALMPPHTHFVETHFGGGAVTLEKDPVGVSEVVNDIDNELTNFWWTLQDDRAFEIFKRLAESTPCSESEFKRAEAHHGFDSSIQANPYGAWRFFILCRQSRAATFKDFTTLAKTRTRRKMNELPSAWWAAIDGLEEIRERLARVVILNRDALEVIRTQDGPQTLFYLDPPYMHETRAAKDVYEHEMTAEQHGELLGTLGSIKGKFLLSGYRSKLYDGIAQHEGWNRHDIEIPNQAAGGKTKRIMTESVWSNF